MSAITAPVRGPGSQLAEAGAPAEIISIDAARRRLRGVSPLEASMQRHPAAQNRPAPSKASEGDSPLRLPVNVFVRASVWLLAAIAAFALALGAGLALRPAPYSGSTWVHSVTAGESVWGLAASLNLPRPLEDVVGDIMSLNGLGSSGLQPGQEILLPGE